MKLSEIKQELIKQFISKITEGVSVYDSVKLLENTSSILGKTSLESCKTLIELNKDSKIDFNDVNKAFDHFTNNKFNTLIAVDEDKVLYIAAREYRKYSHINCTEGTPVPTLTTIGGIKKTMMELKSLNDEIIFKISYK